VTRTRDRIVGRAQEFLSRHGMTNASVGQVAKEADVTRGSVYWHFRAKADLFMAVRQQSGVLPRFPDEAAGAPLRRIELDREVGLGPPDGGKSRAGDLKVMSWKCQYIEDVRRLIAARVASQRTYPQRRFD